MFLRWRPADLPRWSRPREACKPQPPATSSSTSISDSFCARTACTWPALAPGPGTFLVRHQGPAAASPPTATRRTALSRPMPCLGHGHGIPVPQTIPSTHDHRPLSPPRPYTQPDPASAHGPETSQTDCPGHFRRFVCPYPVAYSSPEPFTGSSLHMVGHCPTRSREMLPCVS